jgi:hypothetical protein
MIQSHVIEIEGVFAGVAVLIGPDYRFIAIDPRLEDLDRTQWPTLAEVRRVAGKALHPAAAARMDHCPA